MPAVTNGLKAAPLLGCGSCSTSAQRANCRRADTAALLAERETRRNRLVGVSSGGDNCDAFARLALQLRAHDDFPTNSHDRLATRTLLKR